MELRKDYILDRWVIIATDRKKRLQQFKKDSIHNNDGLCFFCPGNEHLTPPEIGRVPLNDSWQLRWFSNKFPAVKPEGNPLIQTHNEFFTFSDAYGHHEVIAETPNHNSQLWDLSTDELYTLFTIYCHRVNELEKQPHIKYATIFKNHGAEAGTSLIHSHTQIAAINFIPKSIREECLTYKSQDDCPHCRIIEIEKNSERRCFENKRFVAFTPYASRFNFEVWVFPKHHLKTFKEFTEEDYHDLAEIMKNILTKLKALNAPYNYFVHYSPKEENLHFHIEITPRLSKWAGFEFSTETIINTVSPEDAARFFRGEEEVN